jgi:SagB-type dehydrogenase family enzyme
MNTTGKNLKTLAANLPVELLDDVLHFHSKGNICIDEKFRHKIIPHTLTLTQLQALERSDYEISPFHSDAIVCESEMTIPLRRQRSANYFEETPVDFSQLKILLNNAFSMRGDGSRPYPSGGALFPVEVICFIFNDKMIDSPPGGVYHYRPTLKILQPIKQVAADDLRKCIFNMEIPAASRPAFAFLYVGVLSKMLVKYRYRGYRYALMEAGSMYHQADLIGYKLQLRNKLYSGFNDQEVVKFMGLDAMNFLPLVVQSFGAMRCK